MREKEDYRNNIEQLNLKFPDKDMLNVTDISKFTGFDRGTVREIFGKEFIQLGKSKYISKAKLARIIS